MSTTKKADGINFNELLKDASLDAETVQHVKEVQRVAADPPAGTLLVRGLNGMLNFAVDGVYGQGDGDAKMGTGSFTGNTLKQHIQGGTYRLFVIGDTATLELYDSTLQLFDLYKGKGSQRDLDTSSTKPWTGDWF
ncbi:hypothetical protein EWM64_g744 [Hericium alpestre]|uniref:Uncharacterized protein n=1 Tax=Hericium alpestre TaxID=135208 RepID=A0A4Z0A9Q5_9AGAM|nr:hypothetical protein EWM64_g744 [Hericium alpestre]